jgi:hypothetical protein
MYEDAIIVNAYLLRLNAFDYVYEMTTVLLRIFEISFDQSLYQRSALVEGIFAAEPD